MFPFETPTAEALNLGIALPVISLATWATILLILDLFIAKDRKDLTAWLALGGVGFALITTLFSFNTTGEAFMGMFVADPFSAFLNIVVLLTAAIIILMGIDYLKRTGIEKGEYYPLLLLTTVGAMFMSHANDLIVIFVALELLSIPLYVLSAFRAPDLRSEEAGMKYFILGAFASAFFVYGAALVYGATGTTNLPEIFTSVAQIGLVETAPSIFLLLVGAGLMIVGLGFKVAVVPFHTWTPDVYEGAPTVVTAFMSVAAKLGGFAALLRILVVGLPLTVLVLDNGAVVAAWQTIIQLLAIATLLLGNIVAITQTNIKRMLAFSSIAHGGYILMAVAAAGTPGSQDQASQAALVYLLTYMVTNLGAFAVAMSIEKDDGVTGTSIDDFKGLGRSRPILAMIMAVFMLSLTGIPLTAGFIGKWLVFQSVLGADLILLAVAGVLTSVISAFYYVRIIINMYLVDGDGDLADGATPSLRWATYATFAATLLIGIVPVLVTTLSDRVTLLATLP